MGNFSKLNGSSGCANFSIFVPTYCREESLRITLDSVFQYWPKNEIDKIIISDNNSDSQASDIIRNIDSTLISYHKNDENIGIDRNMLHYIDLCESKYCWSLGDDDILNELSYLSVKPFLQEEFDFLIILDGTHKKFKTGIYSFDNENDIGEFFSEFWDKIPFGTFIVNVDLAKKLNYSYNIAKYIGSSHAYSGLLWELVCSDFSTKNVVVIAEKAVDLGVVEKTWADNAVKIYLYEIPLWFRLLPEKLGKYSSDLLDFYTRSISQRAYLILYSKYINKGIDNKKVFFEYLRLFPYSFILKVKLFHLAFPLYKFVVKKVRNKEV